MIREFNSEKVRDGAIMMVKADPGRTAVDLGAGEGFITEGLLNAGCNVIAVDSSPQMVDVLKQRFGHMKEVRILHSGYMPVNIPDDAADYLFAHMHLSRCESPAKTIAEMKRIVKPGGKIAVTDALFHEHPGLCEKYGLLHPGFTLPDMYIWFAQAGIINISVEKSGSVELAGGIKAGLFLAYGEK